MRPKFKIILSRHEKGRLIFPYALSTCNTTTNRMAAPVAKNKKSHVKTLAFDHWV